MNNKDYQADNADRYSNIPAIPGSITTFEEYLSWFAAGYNSELSWNGDVVTAGTNVNAPELNAIQKNCIFDSTGVREDKSTYENYLPDISNLSEYWQNADGGPFNIQLLFNFNITNSYDNPNIKINDTEYTLKLNGINLIAGQIQVGVKYFIVIDTASQSAIINVINIGKNLPTGEIVGTTDTQALSNKDIDSDENNITNIEVLSLG